MLKINQVPDPLRTIGQAAELLGISLNTMRALIDQGEVPTVRVGHRAVRIKPADLSAFVERRTSVKEVRHD